MHRMTSVLISVALAAVIVTGAAKAATVGNNSGSTAVLFSSENAAHDQSNGIPSYVSTPGNALSFSYPDTDGSGVWTITEQVATSQKSFAATFFDRTVTVSHSVYLPYPFLVKVFTWAHYTSWAGNGTCVTTRYQNGEWSNYSGHGWTFLGPTSYVVNHIDACNAWFAGRQGKYEYIIPTPRVHRCPWEVSIDYAWGSSRTYDWGDPSC
jgi:hypothetical protein